MSDITLNRPNNLVISACTEDQTSKETQSYIYGVRGVFTRNLEKILKDGDRPMTITDIQNSSIWDLIDENYEGIRFFNISSNFP